jgi:tetratricopeptide (TPR) repeat protein
MLEMKTGARKTANCVVGSVGLPGLSLVCLAATVLLPINCNFAFADVPDDPAALSLLRDRSKENANSANSLLREAATIDDSAAQSLLRGRSGGDGSDLLVDRYSNYGKKSKRDKANLHRASDGNPELQAGVSETQYNADNSTVKTQVNLGEQRSGNLQQGDGDTRQAASESPSAASSGEGLAEGFKAMHTGDLSKALEIFNNVARARPDSAEAHYGRARTLEYLNRQQDALKEYKIALLLNPVESLSGLCHEHIDRLSKPESLSAGASGAPVTINSQDVEQSINKILGESSEHIRTIQRDAEGLATTVYNSRADALNRQVEQARMEADAMRHARTYRRGRRGYPVYSEADIRAREAEVQYKAASQMAAARSDFEMRRNDADKRAAGVKASAEGLESQMLTRPSETSGVFLIPSGTNLYVRNYAHFDPVLPEPPQALHAVPLVLPQVLKIKEEEHRRNKAAHKGNSTPEPALSSSAGAKASGSQAPNATP